MSGPRGISGRRQRPGHAGRGSRRARRGFSLLEVIIAIAILLAVAALVAPSLSGFSESSEFRETCDQMASVIGICRSEAQRRGVPLELRVAELADGGAGMVSRPVRLGSGEEAGTGAGPREVMLRIPRSYAFGGGGAGGESPDAEAGAETGGPDELVGIFWPNGSVSAGEIEVTCGERRARIRVNSLTGSVKVEEVVVESAGDSAPVGEEGAPAENGEPAAEPE